MRVVDLTSEGMWRGQRVLVIAPHPDDDVLACGGTIARLWSEKAGLRIIYVTDGSRSHVGSRTYPPERLVAIREEEARAGLDALGVPPDRAYFLREPDTALARTAGSAAALVTRLEEHVADFEPTIVLSPWIRDGHGDHVAASKAVRRALARSASSAALYEYTIWLDVFGTPEDAPRPGETAPFEVDVREFRTRKARAIAAHRSQLGGLIDDAEEAFTLPETLLRRTDVDVERFYHIAPGARSVA